MLLGITVWDYHRKEVMSNQDKLWFNTLVTGLSIAIALAVASSLNAMTYTIRWWFLSLRKRPLRQVCQSLSR